MVLRKWIIPDPDPELRLTVDQIDYSKLDYDDCRWIYSSTMKKYYREFSQLEGFIAYATRLFELEELRQKQERKNKQLEKIKNMIPKTPHHSIYDSVNNERFIPITDKKSRGEFFKSFLKKPSKLSHHSESCNIH